MPSSSTDAASLREEIIEKFFRPLAAGVAKAFFTDSLVSYEDLEADALLGCWQAILHFKPGRKKKNGQPCTAFEYFTSCARNEVRAGFRQRNRLDLNNNKLIEKIQDGTVHPSKLKGICEFRPGDTEDEEDEQNFPACSHVEGVRGQETREMTNDQA